MENRDHLEIACTSMELFQNNDSLNEQEFNKLPVYDKSKHEETSLGTEDVRWLKIILQ